MDPFCYLCFRVLLFCLSLLVLTCWERADLFAVLCDVFLCFVTFPYSVMGPVWYLIVWIPDICLLSYFGPVNISNIIVLSYYGTNNLSSYCIIMLLKGVSLEAKKSSKNQNSTVSNFSGPD